MTSVWSWDVTEALQLQSPHTRPHCHLWHTQQCAKLPSSPNNALWTVCHCVETFICLYHLKSPVPFHWMHTPVQTIPLWWLPPLLAPLWTNLCVRVLSLYACALIWLFLQEKVSKVQLLSKPRSFLFFNMHEYHLGKWLLLNFALLFVCFVARPPSPWFSHRTIFQQPKGKTRKAPWIAVIVTIWTAFYWNCFSISGGKKEHFCCFWCHFSFWQY